MSHVFLIGFMGAGKSSVGPLLAEHLRLPFLDLDREIEVREGRSIPTLFEERGESGFREAEHAALVALEDAPSAVVATGGGIVLRDENRTLLRRLGTVVYLTVSPTVAIGRLEGETDRPLLAGRTEEDIAALLDSREPYYREAAHVVIDTDDRTDMQVAEMAAAALVSELPAERGDTAIHVSAATAVESYAILVGPELLATLGQRSARYAASGTAMLVMDAVVAEIFGAQAEASLREGGLAVSRHVVPAGEASKSWEQAGALLEAFSAAGADRGSVAVALGGGVVGDLAGFCAAAYMRGINLVHVPTTLLAQVDSAIGGKTAVDLIAGKNLAGAFWPPKLVLADVAALQSLPEAEWTNGLVELVKAALLEGEDTLARVEHDLAAVVAHEPAAVRRAVWDAAAFKARVVSADLREADVRESLNLGHTLGHALELVVGYGDLPHGLAVAEGMRFAFHLAERLGLGASTLTERGERLLAAVGAGSRACAEVLAPAADRLEPDRLLAAMKSDKKARGGAVRFVLLEAPGRWRADVMADELMLSELERWREGIRKGD